MKLICTVCPVGCLLELEIKNGGVYKVAGNACKRGADYAGTEYADPRRILTTTARMDNGELLPVRSDKPLPKDKLVYYVGIINKLTVKAPVSIGDILIKSIDGTGVNIIASRGS